MPDTKLWSTSNCRYADDTYSIIPAQNVDTRTAELLNIEAWSRENLTFNTTKSMKIGGQVPEMLYFHFTALILNMQTRYGPLIKNVPLNK